MSNGILLQFYILNTRAARTLETLLLDIFLDTQSTRCLEDLIATFAESSVN